MAGVGAGLGMRMGVMPAAERMRAASSTKDSPRKRGSRPTSTRCGAGWVLTYAAMPATARRMLATVNSSATMARQPEVPNLMVVMRRSPLRCTDMVPYENGVGKAGMGQVPDFNRDGCGRAVRRAVTGPTGGGRGDGPGRVGRAAV